MDDPYVAPEMKAVYREARLAAQFLDEHGQIGRDLYCLKCGYNLRGLPAGEHARCPECGYDNPLSLASVPAEEIRRALQKLELMPVAFLTFTAIAVWAAVLAVVWQVRETGPTLCVATAAMMALLCAFACLMMFRYQSKHNANWLGAFLRYQITGAVAVFVLSMPALVVFIAINLDWRSSKVDSVSFVAVLAGVLLMMLFGFVARPLSRFAKAPMQQMQRERAVQIAHESTRRRMMDG